MLAPPFQAYLRGYADNRFSFLCFASCSCFQFSIAPRIEIYRRLLAIQHALHHAKKHHFLAYKFHPFSLRKITRPLFRIKKERINRVYIDSYEKYRTNQSLNLFSLIYINEKVNIQSPVSASFFLIILITIFVLRTKCVIHHTYALFGSETSPNAWIALPRE